MTTKGRGAPSRGAGDSSARLGPVAREVAFSLNSLGLALQQRGRYKEAEPYLVQAIGMWRQTL